MTYLVVYDSPNVCKYYAAKSTQTLEFRLLNISQLSFMETIRRIVEISPFVDGLCVGYKFIYKAENSEISTKFHGSTIARTVREMQFEKKIKPMPIVIYFNKRSYKELFDLDSTSQGLFDMEMPLTITV
jgi:hypothetical protein